MLTLGLICTFVATASAGYASSSSGSGLYSDNSYGDTYGSKYPYSNSYTGSYAGGGAYAGVPVGPYSTPYDFQNQFAQYYNSISELNRKISSSARLNNGVRFTRATSAVGQVRKTQSIAPQSSRARTQSLYNQQLAYQAAIQNQISANFAAIQQAAYGGNYGGSYGYPSSGGVHNRFGGSSAGTSFASGGGFAGGSGSGVGSYAGLSPGGQVYGGTSGAGRPHYSPNYASSGGSVSSNGHHQQHAAIYPANPARPNLDSRFGDDNRVGVTHTSTGNAPGFVGVSSFSSSSDVNGVKNRESGSSVNKNGQVTTYYTRN